MELYQVLEERRSIRKYLPDPVPAATVQKILDAARIAPSWSNLQCWRFIVVRSREKREQLAAALAGGNPAAKAVAEAPVVIVACADPKASGDHDGKAYYLLDTGLALQQLILAAHAEGLGTCWVAWFDEAKARAVCNVPPEYRVVALTPLGVPERRPSPRPRKALAEIAFAEEWGKPLP
jgi:nitroreductase